MASAQVGLPGRFQHPLQLRLQAPAPVRNQRRLPPQRQFQRLMCRLSPKRHRNFNIVISPCRPARCTRRAAQAALLPASWQCTWMLLIRSYSKYSDPSNHVFQASTAPPLLRSAAAGFLARGDCGIYFPWKIGNYFNYFYSLSASPERLRAGDAFVLHSWKYATFDSWWQGDHHGLPDINGQDL